MIINWVDGVQTGQNLDHVIFECRVLITSVNQKVFLWSPEICYSFYLPSFPNPFKKVELSPTDTSFLPSGDLTPVVGPASNMNNVNPQTGNTNVETALLDPDDQAIARTPGIRR